MKIAIAGGSGFIGRPLAERLSSAGHDVLVLTRAPVAGKSRSVGWDGRSQGAWSREVASADAVVNLAGESIAGGRWTAARKRRLVQSRIDATRAIVEALGLEPTRPRVLVNSSAIGFYGLHGDESLDESSSRGAGFLADLSASWEEEARSAQAVARVVILRFGIVLGSDGGALGKLLLPFRLGVGGPVGTGRQWMSWIDRDDALRLVMWAIDTPTARGVYNATAPEPVTNRDFVRELGRALRRPAVLPAPAFALRLALGAMADEALLGGQRVLPARAEAEGFRFEARTIAESLRRQV